MTESIERLLAVYRNRAEATILWRLLAKNSVGKERGSALAKFYKSEEDEKCAVQAILNHPAVKRGLAELRREESLLEAIKLTEEADDGIPF